jgi:hypothetical protein
MPTVALQTHFDRQRIVLDEPYADPAEDIYTKDNGQPFRDAA